MSLADDFAAMADQLMALGSVDATLVKKPSQAYNTTTLKTVDGTPVDVAVKVAHMKATASRLSGFNIELDPNDHTRRLEFYYLRGGSPELGDRIRFADSSEMTVLALSKIDVQGVAIVYQLLLEA